MPWLAALGLLLSAAAPSAAQTTYYVRALAAVNVGVDGTTNMTTLADMTVTGGSSNQNRAMTNNTAPTGTARWRVREGASDTRTGQEFFRAYTPTYAAATVVAANATAYADFYMNATGTSVTAKATLYEYNDTTGIVGAAKGTASFTGNAGITTRQTMNNVSFGNAQFTVAAGNRLLVVYSFDMNASRPAYLWGQTPSNTPSGYQSFIVSESPAAVNSTTAGTVTAVSTTGACNSITVDAPYTNDANGNNTLSYRYRTPSGTGAWQGPFTRTHSASPYNFNITGLTHGASYDVEVTYVDADGVTGANLQTVANVLVGGNCTGAGTVTAAQTTGATPSIAIGAPYTFDANANNTLSYRYRTPSGTGAWTAPTNVAHSASPYSITLSGLTCGSTYDVEVTYNDADGIGSGTQVQTVSNILLSNCTATGAVTANGTPCGSIDVTAPYASDANADNILSYRYRTPAGTGAWTAPTSLPHSGSPYGFSITGLAAGTYDVEATYGDADGVSGANPQTVSNISVTANCTSVGTVTATATSCTQITVSAPFSGDANGNGTTNVEYNTSNTWPGTTACASLTGASPRSCPVSGLTNATAYYFRVTFADADGVAGTNPQVVGPASTLDCRVTPQTSTATADSCSQVTVSAPYTGDANGNSATSVNRGASAAGPFPTAVCSNLSGASPRSCVDNTVAATTTYYYQVTFADPDGVSGAATQVTSAVTTPSCSVNNTTAATLATLASSCNSVTTAATFTGDDNNNGSVMVEYNTTNTWPGTTACAAASGASPRQCVVTGLSANTTYWFRATFSDVDGVAGTNPTAATSAATAASCGADAMAPTITVLTPSRNAILSGADTVKVQVFDAGGLAVSNPVQWQADGTAPGGFSPTGVAANGNYNCGTSCTVYEITLPAQAAGSHYIAIRATDAAGNNALVTWAFRTRTSGAGTILRRTTGSQLCLDCHNLQTHNSQYTSTNYGNWAMDCASCHTPHATTNIYLIRPLIETPMSGVKSVDFRNTLGAAANSFANPSASPNPPSPPGVCEACHTRTKNSDSTPRARNNAWTDWSKHYTSTCTGCHTHGKGFAAGESDGSATCSGCHKAIWDGMTGAVVKTTKHTLGSVLGTNDSFTDVNLTWGSPLSGNAAAVRSCVNMCHDDHPHVATDAANPALHNYLAYDDATSQASRAATTRTVTTKASTDFDNTRPNGGVCVSCHRSPVDASHPAIGQANYNASAHNTTNTTPGGAWQYTLHDGSNFARNCTKCHWDRNDGTTPTVANKTGLGAVHSSGNPSLLAGKTNPNGNASNDFICYDCHGNGTTGINYSSKDIATQIAKANSHPVNADNAHDSMTEFNNAAFGNTLGVASRHANCLDCHNTHEVKAGAHTAQTNLAGPPLQGAWGAQLSTNPARWAAPTGANFTKKTIVSGTDAEATLCFKCHSSYYWGTGAPPVAPSGPTYTTGTATFTNGSTTVTGSGTTWRPTNWPNYYVGWLIKNNADGAWYTITAVASNTSLTIGTAYAGATASGSAYTIQMPETDTAQEFNPNNTSSGATAGSFHPVLASAGSNLGATSNIKAPWTRTSLMTCSDCHASDTTTDPNGPHGSAAGFILKGPNTTWNASVVTGSGGMPNGTFCINCHEQDYGAAAGGARTSRYAPGGNLGDGHVKSNHLVACFNCHSAIPHGTARPGLLVAVDQASFGDKTTDRAPWRQHPTGTNNGLYIYSYPASNTTSWAQNNCGCGTSGGH